MLLLRLHLLLRFGHQSGSFWYGRLFSRAALAARCGVYEHFNVWVMGRRSGRRDDVLFEDGVKMTREVMAARVYVDGGVKGPDVDGFLDAPFYPVLF